MSYAVTALVLADRGPASGAADRLDRTVAALRAQQRASLRIVIVNVRGEAGAQAARRLAPDLLLTLDAGTGFAAAMWSAAQEAERRLPEISERWLWLLGAGDEPDDDALAELLVSVESSPSLRVTGPKLLALREPGRILEVGQTTTRSGRTVRLGAGELDQGQHDDRSDVLAVGRTGMLVHAATWRELHGFDPGLRHADAALDLGTRVWLSGDRVAVSPRARVRSEWPSDPGERRWHAALLHRRVRAAGRFGAFLHRLLLVPAALLLALWQLLRKQPGLVLPRLAAAFEVATGRTGVGAARERYAATRTEPRGVVTALQLPRAEERRRRALDREQRAQEGSPLWLTLLEGPAPWTLLAVAVLGLLLAFPLFGADALRGGGLLPLRDDAAGLWAQLGTAPADPFQLVLALTDSLTFWQPSLSLVALWYLALPLSALTAWLLAVRLTSRSWLRAVLAVAWALAPPLQAALQDGRPATVLVHVLLPVLALTARSATRSWGAAAQTALLAALIGACAPSLLPALGVLWLLLLLTGGRGWFRALLVPIPAIALFAPLAVAQWQRGTPLAVLADPGVPVTADPVRGLAAVLGLPDAGLGGWASILQPFASSPALLLGIVLAPLLLLAVLGLCSRAWRLAVPAVPAVAVGLLTAGAAGGIVLAWSGNAPVALDPGPAQSLLTGGLLVAAGAALAAGAGSAAGAGATGRRRLAAVAAGVLLVATATLAAPSALGQWRGSSVVAADRGALPAIVVAEAAQSPSLGTLLLTPLTQDAVRATLLRGEGETLDGQSSLDSTAVAFSAAEQRLAELAVGLLSPSDDSIAQLRALGIGFVLLEPGDAAALPITDRLRSGLSAASGLQQAGQTASGELWRVVDAAQQPEDPALAQQLTASGADTPLGHAVLAGQALVLLLTIVLALPGARTRPRTDGTSA